MASVQTLSDDHRRVVAAWAADCADRVLHLFEREAPDEPAPRDGIERARAYARGDVDAASQIRLRFMAGRAARAATTPAGKAAARAAGQASGVAHLGAHALGAAAYAGRAAELAAPGAGGAGELDWQLTAVTEPVRTALALLPPLGQDRSGPLGPGLLATGALGVHIRSLKQALEQRPRG